MEFVSGSEDEIIVDWDGEGTFLLRTMNHYAAHYDADIYTEIKECIKEGAEPEAYRKLFDEKETDPNYFPIIGMIAYSEEDGFVELIEVLAYYFTQDGRKVLGWQLQAK